MPTSLSEIFLFLSSSLHHVVVTSLNKCIVCVVEKNTNRGIRNAWNFISKTLHCSSFANGGQQETNNKGINTIKWTKRSSDLLLKGKGAWPQEEPRSSTVVIGERSHRRAGLVGHYDAVKISFPRDACGDGVLPTALQHLGLRSFSCRLDMINYLYCFIAINFGLHFYLLFFTVYLYRLNHQISLLFILF